MSAACGDNCTCQLLPPIPLDLEPDNSLTVTLARKSEARLKGALEALEELRIQADPELVRYGGSDFRRHVSIAITKVEEALLWSGSYLPSQDV